MNPVIRADGSPKFAMASTLAGALVNIILDPVFIFVLRWGMMGAAVATVADQIVTAVRADTVCPDSHGGSRHRDEIFSDCNIHCSGDGRRMYPYRRVQHGSRGYQESERAFYETAGSGSIRWYRGLCHCGIFPGLADRYFRRGK